MAASRFSSRGDANPAGASTTYREISAILGKYVTVILVHSTLKSALEMRSIAPQGFSRVDAPVVIEHAMVGLRLFCDPKELPALMLELADYCTRIS